MKNTRTVLIGIALALGGAMQAHAEPSKTVETKTARIFPAPECDVKLASESVEYRLSEIGVPTWDGDLPWPWMIGYWAKLDRDLYMTVSMEEFAQNEFGRIVVTFRSVCAFAEMGEHNYLAYGAKLVTESDFKKKTLNLPLRNLGLNGSSLIAVLEIVTDDAESQQCTYKKAKLKVTIREKTRPGLTPLKDSFIAERMLQ